LREELRLKEFENRELRRYLDLRGTTKEVEGVEKTT